MSLAAFISQHEKPILTNELVPFLLAWLDKVGAASEDELCRDLALEKTNLNRTLLDLYSDKCIEYGEKSVLLSERGKSLLDRLGVSETVLRNTIKDLDLLEDESEFFFILLTLYRQYAFDDYRRTVQSSRAWVTACDTAFIFKDESSNKESKATGKAALFLRAAWNWYVHSPQWLVSKYQKTPHFQKLDDALDGKSYSLEKNSQMQKVLIWLTSVDSLHYDMHLDNLLKDNDAEYTFALFCFLDECMPTNQIYTTWSKCLAENPADPHPKSRAGAGRIFHKVLEELSFSTPGQLKYIRSREMLNRRLKWYKNTLEPSAVLNSIFSSNSVDEFCENAGLPKDSGSSMLEQIRLRCVALLPQKK